MVAHSTQMGGMILQENFYHTGTTVRILCFGTGLCSLAMIAVVAAAFVLPRTSIHSVNA